MEKKKNFFALMVVILLLSACASPKRITYVHDMEPYVEYAITQHNQIKIQEGDRLEIIVDAPKAELAMPFNNRRGVVRISESGDMGVSTQAREVIRGYLVDEDGNIEFPILGRIQVAGMTHKQLSSHIEEQLRLKNLINDAVVTVELLNLKVIVLNEDGNSSVVKSEDNKLTLLEVVGRSMDNVKMKEVAVIREEAGFRKMYTVNLQSVQLFDSPVYYLQQNDIVYLRPSSAPLPPRFYRVWSNVGIVTGFANLVLTYLVWRR